MRGFDEIGLREAVISQCDGQQQCQVSLDQNLFGVLAGEQNYDQFVFVQASCEQDDDMLELKKALGLGVSVIGLFMCLYYHISLTYMRNTNLINEKIFDSELITLGDYSVQGQITQSQWEKFFAQIGSDEYAMMDFEECLTFEIKSWLQRADQGKNIGELIYEVADIQLAFDNNQMMNLLAKRANALRKRNFAKAKRIQEQMTKYKNENFEKLFIPKKFFCTFRTEYAYHKALEVNTF